MGTIKSAAFAWYLGGSIETAVLNLTQNVIVGVPRLQMDVEGGARADIDGAQKQIVNQYARRFTGDKGKGLSEEEARLIQDLYGDALITDAYMEEVRGQVTGGPSTRLWNKLMKVMGYPMSVAERFNRGSLALAAFRAARDGKMKAAARKRYGVEGEKATYEQAKAFAEEIVRDSHFVYGKTNAPELLRSSTAGRGLGAAFTFKTFTANLLGLWSWALRTQGKEGAIMVAKGLGATAALGGLVALPFYATLMALFQAATGDDDDWTEAIRKQLPQNTMLRDIVCYGLPAGAGVNLGGSLKMETCSDWGDAEGRHAQGSADGRDRRHHRQPVGHVRGAAFQGHGGHARGQLLAGRGGSCAHCRQQRHEGMASCHGRSEDLKGTGHQRSGRARGAQAVIRRGIGQAARLPAGFRNQKLRRLRRIETFRQRAR